MVTHPDPPATRLNTRRWASPAPHNPHNHPGDRHRPLLGREPNEPELAPQQTRCRTPASASQHTRRIHSSSSRALRLRSRAARTIGPVSAVENPSQLKAIVSLPRELLPPPPHQLTLVRLFPRFGPSNLRAFERGNTLSYIARQGTPGPLPKMAQNPGPHDAEDSA
ncbi:hypothetical protein PtB15_9B544 [Puccinia triticina]|nr:hypothetical protein PtB15_9B544 [Puccinia triticina]